MLNWLRRVSSAMAIVAAGALGGCQTVPSVPPQTAITSTCAHQIEFSTPRPLAPVDADNFKAEINFGGDTSCVFDALSRPSVYAVVALPDSSSPMMLSVSSRRLGTTLFSPRLELYDKALTRTRTVERDSFQFSGASLLTQVRHRPEEKWLAIFSDSASAGSGVKRIESHVVNSGAVVGPVYVPVNTGSEAATESVFTVNGTVVVQFQPIPNADKR